MPPDLNQKNLTPII